MVQKLAGLLAYASPHRWAILGLFVVTLLAAATTALQPWPLKWLVDVLGANFERGAAPVITTVASSRGTLLILVCLAGLILFALQAALDALSAWGWTVIGRRMVYALAADMFAHLQRRSLLYHSRNAVGETITRATWDCWALYRFFDGVVMKPVYALLSIALMLLLMSRVDLLLTTIAAVVALFGVATSFLAGHRIRASAELQRRLEGDLKSHVQQTLSGISVVQTYGQERLQQDQFADIASRLLRAQQQNTLVAGVNGLASGVALSLGGVLIIAIGAYRAIDGQITIGSVLLFTAYLSALQSQLKTMVAAYPMLQNLMASVIRIDEVLATPPEVRERGNAMKLAKSEGHVRFEAVGFAYDGRQRVLEEVSFEALPGQTIAIVGATGAGKSTLVSLIPRFFDPTSGRVLLDGRDLRDIGLASLRHQIAIVFQEPFLFPASIAENIAFGRPDATRQEIENAAKAARAHDFIMRSTDGYDSFAGERGTNFSGGERQRLALARAFLKQAPIIILDEPTSAVDAETEAQILQAVRDLSRSRTTFIIAHRLSTIRSADQLIVLHHGRIVERGSPAELAAHGGLYSRLHALDRAPSLS